VCEFESRLGHHLLQTNDQPRAGTEETIRPRVGGRCQKSGIGSLPPPRRVVKSNPFHFIGLIGIQKDDTGQVATISGGTCLAVT
jgi:hypothetical protein